jgi:hypothetical protein
MPLEAILMPGAVRHSVRDLRRNIDLCLYATALYLADRLRQGVRDRFDEAREPRRYASRRARGANAAPSSRHGLDGD